MAKLYPGNLLPHLHRGSGERKRRGDVGVRALSIFSTYGVRRFGARGNESSRGRSGHLCDNLLVVGIVGPAMHLLEVISREPTGTL